MQLAVQELNWFQGSHKIYLDAGLLKTLYVKEILSTLNSKQYVGTMTFSVSVKYVTVVMCT